MIVQQHDALYGEAARPNGRRPASGAPSGAQGDARDAREDRSGLTAAQCEQLRPRVEKGARERRLQQIDRRIAGGHGGLTFAFNSDRYELHGRDPVSREDGCLARYEAHADVGLVDMHASAHEDLIFLRQLLTEAFDKIRDLKSKIARNGERHA